MLHESVEAAALSRSTGWTKIDVFILLKEFARQVHTTSTYFYFCS